MRVTILVLGALLVMSGCKKSDGGASAPPPDHVQRAGSMVVGGRVPPNSKGLVELPANLKAASTNEKAYVTKDPDGRMWVLLPTKIDSASSFKAWLYTNNPPADAPTTVKVVGPDDAGGARSVDVTVEGSPASGWYAVHAGG